MSALTVFGSVSWATTYKLDGLLAINDAPSPCLGVRVKVFEGSKLKTEVILTPDGKVKPVGRTPAPAPQFMKGKTYSLEGTCVSTSNTYQHSQLKFTAEGRTVMVVFTKMGFLFKRGGLAY
ncbi:hypothetical protein [Deinococcus sp. QL22]|uniref:hypothetical protein n=1 Tax=Deinococcus sp. QL22 TaxID=2939437 RepID=UPI0020182EB3|nr:hypothetical protein [Deinococcus sp. QL22]UQN08612.1 hypothetical protein M1R55_21015 [Deinococcus sp. QL22]